MLYSPSSSMFRANERKPARFETLFSEMKGAWEMMNHGSDVTRLNCTFKSIAFDLDVIPGQSDAVYCG